MIRLRGGRVVTPDAVLDDATLAVDDGRIVAVTTADDAAPGDVDCRGGWIVPGFVDTHVHGAHGVDVLAGGDAVARVASTLPRYGVTAFAPTSVACPPETLARFLAAVAAARNAPAPDAARVLGAHLESNFIHPDYAGAQPAACLRLPPRPGDAGTADGAFPGAAILAAIDAQREAVRIVTLAPELPGALDLVARLVAAGHRVSLGHSGATFEQGCAAIAAGARHATHLFNRMPPLGHRTPGLAGAVIAAPEVVCEIVVDGVHVHPAVIAMVVRAKGPGGVAAITDGTAGSGLAAGSTCALGDQTIHVRADRAELADGTLAGSIATMDGVFRRLVTDAGLSPVEASHVTATTPAAALGRPDLGRLQAGLPADFAVLDAGFGVRATWIAGRLAWNSAAGGAVSPEQR